MNSGQLNQLSDQVLEHIRKRVGHYFDLRHMARKFRATKADILVAIDLLRRAGYDIKANAQSQYAFITAPDALLAAEIKHGLKTTFLGQNIYAYQTVQSTNTIAGQLAEVRATEGTIVVAEEQTRGRGRLGRNWFSPQGNGIYLSMILYPKIAPNLAPGLSIMTAISLADTIMSYDDLDVKVKWPNDCLISGRKVAGILTELSAEVGRVNHVIIGCGINVNQKRRDFPPEIQKIATSLRAELKEEISRVEFLQKFLQQFEKDYGRFKKSGVKGIRKKLVQYSSLLGEEVALELRSRRIIGTAVDIDDNGNLVLDTPQGVKPFNAGEVTVLKG